MFWPLARKDARPFSFSPPSGFCPSRRVQAAVLNFFFGLFFSAIKFLLPRLFQLTILREDRQGPQALVFLCPLCERDVNVLVVAPVTGPPLPPLTAVSARSQSALVHDVLDAPTTRQARRRIRNQLVSKFLRCLTVAPLALLAHVLVNVDGVNPTIFIRVVIGLALRVRSIPNPSIAPLISTGPSTIDLIAEDDTALYQLSH